MSENRKLLSPNGYIRLITNNASMIIVGISSERTRTALSHCPLVFCFIFFITVNLP